MGANTAENTNLRLKAVLDVLAEEVWTGEKLNAGAVLGEAIARVPLNDHERELLSGGILRGHKTLTTTTAKLVKAGWLVKGRSRRLRRSASRRHSRSGGHAAADCSRGKAGEAGESSKDSSNAVRRRGSAVENIQGCRQGRQAHRG